MTDLEAGLSDEAARALYVLLARARVDLFYYYRSASGRRAELGKRLRAAAFGILDAVGWPPGPDADVNHDVLEAEDIYRLNDLAEEFERVLKEMPGRKHRENPD